MSSIITFRSNTFPIIWSKVVYLIIEIYMLVILWMHTSEAFYLKRIRKYHKTVQSLLKLVISMFCGDCQIKFCVNHLLNQKWIHVNVKLNSKCRCVRAFYNNWFWKLSTNNLKTNMTSPSKIYAREGSQVITPTCLTAQSKGSSVRRKWEMCEIFWLESSLLKVLALRFQWRSTFLLCRWPRVWGHKGF